MSALSLYRKHSKAALVEMDALVFADPVNKNVSGGLFLHTPKARKLLAHIGQAIAFHMDDDRTETGRPVPCAGYSGRMSNK
jgi:hypothetical protein